MPELPQRERLAHSDALNAALSRALAAAQLTHGSIHSDYWRGTAVALAQRAAIGVYPVGGWWKESPQHKRYDRHVRYALIVSIRATNGAVDIYTPVRAQIAVLIAVTT